MPRKRREAKFRREKGFPIHSLSICDTLHICCGLPSRDRIFRWDMIKDMDDMRAAWEENKALFMTVCTCRAGGQMCVQHKFAHAPGTRPFAWWVFEHGLEPDEVPPMDEQRAELERMGVITDLERSELDKIARREAELATQIQSLNLRVH